MDNMIMDLVNEYLNNVDNSGNRGMAGETLIRYILTGKIERCHGGGETDVTVKSGVALECKSGCGWLAEPSKNFPGYASRMDAENALAEKLNALYSGARSGWQIMPRAKHVAYIVKYDGTNIQDTRILTQKAFLRMLADNKLIRVKQSRSTGLWGFAIQSYIPTPKFRASAERYQRVLDTLETGMTITEYANKMGLWKE